MTLSEQIARLKQRGLVFDDDDESEASAYLFNISYYQLLAYTYPFQDNGKNSEHNFILKEYITKQFGLKKVAIWENRLHAISNLRNCCAHHSHTVPLQT